MISIRIELRNQATEEVLDIFQKDVRESDNVGAFLDEVRMTINYRLVAQAEAFYYNSIKPKEGGQ